MEKKTLKNILLAIMGLLILAELIIGIMTMTKDNLPLALSKLLSLVFVTLYGFWLYKKPHGNMLKYAMLILSVSEILNAILCIKMGWEGTYPHNTIRIFIATLLVYVAGRLNRIEQNKYLLTVAVVAHLVNFCVFIVQLNVSLSPLYVLTWSSGTISTITLVIAYFVRYKEHKEAGIAEVSKK